MRESGRITGYSRQRVKTWKGSVESKDQPKTQG